VIRVVVLAVLASVVVGCAKTTEVAVPAEGAAPFASRAASICRDMAASAKRVAPGRKPTDAELGRLLDRWQAGLARLTKLQPPPARAASFRQMLAHYRHMTEALRAMTAAEDESVLPDVAAAVVEGTRGGRAARRSGLAACAFFPDIKQPPRDDESTLEAARALVPNGAHVVAADTAACNDEKSCRFQFRATGSTPLRLHSMLARLRSKGWSHLRTGRSPTGTTWAVGYRNDHEATIEFLGGHRPPHCPGRSPAFFGCSDSVWVQRVEIPDVLTSG
jgi:hypothetical protein